MWHSRIIGWSIALFCQLTAGLALAVPEPPDTKERDAEPREPPAIAAGRSGAFMAWTEGARTDTHRLAAKVHGGYDSASASALSHARLDAVLLEPDPRRRAPATGQHVGLAALASASWSEQDGDARLEAGVKAHFVFQEDSGFDLAASVSYQNEGFNLRPAVASMLLFGTRAGAVTLLANLEYAHGLSDDERAGHARFGALSELGRRWIVGLDAHASFDLELDDDEPEGEPQMHVRAGPVISALFDNFFVSAQGGVSVLQLRFGEPRAGAVVMLGAGAAL